MHGDEHGHTSLLSPVPPFDIYDEFANVSVRWKLWLERFETFLVASDIKDDTRKRAIFSVKIKLLSIP